MLRALKNKMGLFFLFAFFIFFQIFIFKAYGEDVSVDKKFVYDSIQSKLKSKIAIVANEKKFDKKLEKLNAFLEFPNNQLNSNSEAISIANSELDEMASSGHYTHIQVDAKQSEVNSKQIINNAWAYIVVDTEPLEAIFVKNQTEVYNCENIKYKLDLNLPKENEAEKDWAEFTASVNKQIAALVKNLCAARPKSL